MKTFSKNKYFGLGLDLFWGAQEGFVLGENGFRVSKNLRNFLSRYENDFDHFFFSIQPMNFDLLFSRKTLDQYFRAYDELLEVIPKLRRSLSLHHTFLNMATNEKDYPKEEIVNFTNKIIDRYNIKWINEDLGLWLIKGKVLPYPLPPVLNRNCLKHCVENINFYKKNLNAELYVEFPGFSEGNSFFLGDMDAFDFFTEVISETEASCVLDTGHLLSYQWHSGNTSNYLKNLEKKLPIDWCKEIHLSGCSIIGDEFFDFHHGVILDQQIEMLNFLLLHCKKLETVTYEDPKFLPDGELIKKSIKNYKNLKAITNEWKYYD